MGFLLKPVGILFTIESTWTVSQSVKSVKWKLDVEKFWLKSYLSPTFTFSTFSLAVFNFRKFGITRITICRTKQLGPQGQITLWRFWYSVTTINKIIKNYYGPRGEGESNIPLQLSQFIVPSNLVRTRYQLISGSYY